MASPSIDKSEYEGGPAQTQRRDDSEDAQSPGQR